MHFLIGNTERFGDVDSKLLLQVDEDDHPVCLASGLQVVLVKRSYTQKLKDLILVDILTHIAYNVLLQISKLEKFAKINEVELVFICEA